MSEQQNIEHIGKLYDAFSRGDIGYILEQLTPDVRWFSHNDPVVPWAGDFSGRVGKFFEAIGQGVEVTAFAPGEFIAQGDTVVSLGTFGGRVRATGKSTQTQWVFIWKLRDGRVASYEQFHDSNLANAFR